MENEQCTWTFKTYWHDLSDAWETSCGEVAIFDAEGPIEGGFKFCHYCGKPLLMTTT